jgi:hypothetical protein
VVRALLGLIDGLGLVESLTEEEPADVLSVLGLVEAFTVDDSSRGLVAARSDGESLSVLGRLS